MNDFITAADLWRPGPGVYPFMKGRVALYAILKAAGIGPGDEVVLPGFTCVVVPAAVKYTGATPVFYDIEPDTYNGNPELAIAAVSPSTKAIIVQHTFGVPAELGGIVDLCRNRGILLIEDCAHAMGAFTVRGPVGTFGDAAFASLQWSKPVSTGLGGLARVNEGRLAQRLRVLLRDEFHEPALMTCLSLLFVSSLYSRWFRPGWFWHARDFYRRLGRLGLMAGSSSPPELVELSMPPAYKQRYGKLRLRQLDRVLESLPIVIEHRNRIAEIYADWCRRRRLPQQRIPAGAHCTHLRFPLTARDREPLLATARAERVELGDWFNAPLHPMDANREVFGYRRGMCPIADTLSASLINLPTHPRVSTAGARRILAFLDRNIDLVGKPQCGGLFGVGKS